MENKRKKTININKSGSTNKTRKIVPTNAIAICSQRFIGIEEKYKKRFKKEVERTYKEMHNSLLHAFRIPFSPSNYTPQSDYYTYINYRWLQDANKKYESKKEIIYSFSFYLCLVLDRFLHSSHSSRCISVVC